nr:hypothetical protein [Levilactobacillus namurensis]
MQNQLKVIANPNLIQVQLAHFIQIIEPIYQTIDKKYRHRCNYREEKASDVLILASMLLRMTWRDNSEVHFHRILVASGVPLPERSRYNRRCRELVAFERYIRFRLLN